MIEIHVDRHANRIWLASRFVEEIKTSCASQPGAGWAGGDIAKAWAKHVAGYGANGAWSFPLNYRTCLDLRREFGKSYNLIIHSQLWDWAAAEKRKRDDLRGILRAASCPTPVLERLYPRLAEAVHARPFQSVGIAFASRARVSANFDEAGLGKTLQAAGTAVEMELTGAHLVIAPTGAQQITWPDEFEDWLPGEKYYTIAGSKEKRRKLLDEFWMAVDRDRNNRHWAFCNLEMLQRDRYSEKVGRVTNSVTSDEPRFPQLFARPWQAIVIDECHKILPTRSAFRRDQSLMRAGAQDLVVIPGGLKMALSGTPFRGNPLNAWGTLHWLLPNQHPGYWAWVERWYEITQEDEAYGREIGDLIGSQEKAYGVELDAISVRRTKLEVAPDLPPRLYGGTHLIPGDMDSQVGVWLELTPQQRRAYDAMTSDAEAALDSGMIVANGILMEMLRFTQLAATYGDVRKIKRRTKNIDPDTGEWELEEVDEFYPTFPSNKYNWIVDFLAERGIERKAWGDAKVVIASQFTRIIDLFADRLRKDGIPCHVFTGKTKIAERRKAKAEFLGAAGPRVFLLNTWSGGVSLTLDSADDLIFIDQTWVPDDQEQVEDRIHRLSRMHQVSIWPLFSRGTIDEYRARTNETKDRIQKRLLDGRRGVAFAKQLLTGRAA